MKHRAIIVSDLHLGTKDSQTNDFIQFIIQNPTDLLILNGDIIDGWALNRGSKWKNKHTKVINKILKLSQETRVVWIRGNHDEFIKDFIDTKYGNIEIKENFILEITKWKTYDVFEKRNYFVFHGDIIDVFITKYKWIAKLGSIGYDMALWINRMYNRFRSWRKLPYRSISKDIKSGVKGAVNYVNDFENSAVKLAKEKGCFGVICGHIHQPSDRMIGEHHYLNSGDWVENRTGIIVKQNGDIEIIHFENKLIENPIKNESTIY